MKAITLTQPYATLIALGMKKIETRSWSTRYRGPLAIHAAKGLGPVGGKHGLEKLCGTQPFFDVLMTIVPDYNRYCDRNLIADALPLGAIVAVCELRHIVQTETITHYQWAQAPIEAWVPGERWDLTGEERAFGNYEAGRYAWLLADVRLLPEPIVAKGALGLWEWEGTT